MRTDRVYKVFRRRDDQLVSYFVVGEARQTYPVLVWTGAPDWLAEHRYGPLCFGSLRSAVAFAELIGYAGKEVWLCEARGRRWNLPADANIGELDHGSLYPFVTPSWPRGTRMYAEVMPVEKVWPEEE